MGFEDQKWSKSRNIAQIPKSTWEEIRVGNDDPIAQIKTGKKQK